MVHNPCLHEAHVHGGHHENDAKSSGRHSVSDSVKCKREEESRRCSGKAPGGLRRTSVTHWPHTHREGLPEKVTYEWRPITIFPCLPLVEDATKHWALCPSVHDSLPHWALCCCGSLVCKSGVVVRSALDSWTLVRTECNNRDKWHMATHPTGVQG